MELSFLYAIPHNEILDKFFLLVTAIAGSYGQIWLIVGVALLFFKKTRRAGAAVLLSYVFVFVLGQYVLKNLFDRPRPCHVDQAFQLLVDRPSSSSFPSTHSAWSFAAATAIFMRHRKAGIPVFIVAAIIAFSRMYLFLHFPTDVLVGIVFGVVVGLAATFICNLWKKDKMEENGTSGDVADKANGPETIGEAIDKTTVSATDKAPGI
ncbi:MAG: phosphatase PAP2 family protein [Lachnospiraceae bacterium]|nr:phosphatase PAP2 family protein [Lachnospiraceae bacterium]